MRALTTARLLITAPAPPHRCFLLTYASMNLNCFFLDYLKDPTWRPRWKYFHWSSGLAGFVLCVTVQFLIDWIYAIIAWVLWLVLLIFIVRLMASDGL
jgi:solute carrier family 12 (potassium/chloride transporter), member 4/6